MRGLKRRLRRIRKERAVGENPVVTAARKIYENDQTNFDVQPAVEPAPGGCWVSAWVWVPRNEYEDAA